MNGLVTQQPGDRADAVRFRRLCELHDGVDTLWNVRGADGQPIEVGRLRSAIDELPLLADVPMDSGAPLASEKLPETCGIEGIPSNEDQEASIGRIVRYLAERKKRASADKEIIHALHQGGPSEAELRVSDLSVLLSIVRSETALQRLTDLSQELGLY